MIWLLALVIVLTQSVGAQGVYEWGPAVAVTDTSTFNSNPTAWLIDNQQFGIFYEKQTCDSCNVGLWFRNLTTMEDEIPVLVDTQLHYNPVFIQANANDFKGFLLYLSSPDGDTNIFASRLENNFIISETTQLTFTETTPSNMGYSDNYIDHLAWVEDSCVFSAIPLIQNGQIALTELTKLDSMHNTDIKIGNQTAYFQRNVGDSLHIYGRDYAYDHGSGEWYWDETFPVKTTGNNTDMSVDNSEFSAGNELIWVTDNQIHGFAYSYEFVLNTFNLPNIQHPGYIMWDIVVKDEWMPHVLVYSTGEGDNTEIYGSFSPYGNSPDTTNLTYDGVRDSNPDLFWGEFSGNNGFWIYAVWQSHRNGHIALYYSKFLGFIEGGLDEQEDTDISLSVSPNPFNREIKINVSSISGEDIQISVYSLSGRLVWKHFIPATNQPVKSCVWVPGSKVAKGTYLVVATQNGAQTLQRVVYK